MNRDTRLTHRKIRILEDMFGRLIDGESMQDIADSHGISRKTLSTWKNTNHGRMLHAEYRRKMGLNDIPIFYQVLSEKMQTGSYKHMELFAKLTGLLERDRIEETLKVEKEHDIKEHGLTAEMIAEIDAALDESEAINPVNIRRIK